MYTILSVIVGLIITSSGSYVAYRRCKEIQDIKHPILIAVILFFVILLVSGYLAKTELLGYLTNIVSITSESIFNLLGIYIFIALTGLYIVFVLITEDLLKNLSIFLDFFERLIRK